jgi:hypothetical protein
MLTTTTVATGRCADPKPDPWPCDLLAHAWNSEDKHQIRDVSRNRNLDWVTTIAGFRSRQCRKHLLRGGAAFRPLRCPAQHNCDRPVEVAAVPAKFCCTRPSVSLGESRTVGDSEVGI